MYGFPVAYVLSSSSCFSQQSVLLVNLKLPTQLYLSNPLLFDSSLWKEIINLSRRVFLVKASFHPGKIKICFELSFP